MRKIYAASFALFLILYVVRVASAESTFSFESVATLDDSHL